MFEIGIDQSKSLNMWLELFPQSFIYGMDIKKSCSEDRYNVIKGDQSNETDLQNIKNLLKDKNLFLIIDDGSHYPDHQILTFNYLFPLLIEEGIYIIEDIETSYWKKGKVYNYKTKFGYKHPNSIIEIFKNEIDNINSEFAGTHKNKIQHNNMISSITFFKNCIIIIKKKQIPREYRFKKNL